MAFVDSDLTAVMMDAGEVNTLVVSTMSGALRCVPERTVWCSHVLKSMRQGLDSKSIWYDYTKHRCRSLLIPVVPSHNVYANVALEYKEERDCFFVFLEGAANGEDSSAFPNAEARIFQGVICRGDGRMQIRQMIHGWLVPGLDVAFHLKCRSAKHGPLRDNGVRREWHQDKSLAIAHLWANRWFGKCYHCLKEEGPTTTWDSDLIPAR